MTNMKLIILHLNVLSSVLEDGNVEPSYSMSTISNLSDDSVNNSINNELFST
jgi:hypothetical protein